MDSDLLTSAEAIVKSTLVSRVLKPKSNIRSSGDVEAAGKVFKEKKVALLPTRRPFCGKFRLYWMERKCCRSILRT